MDFVFEPRRDGSAPCPDGVDFVFEPRRDGFAPNPDGVDLSLAKAAFAPGRDGFDSAPRLGGFGFFFLFVSPRA